MTATEPLHPLQTPGRWYYLLGRATLLLPSWLGSAAMVAVGLGVPEVAAWLLVSTLVTWPLATTLSDPAFTRANFYIPLAQQGQAASPLGWEVVLGALSWAPVLAGFVTVLNTNYINIEFRSLVAGFVITLASYSLANRITNLVRWRKTEGLRYRLALAAGYLVSMSALIVLAAPLTYDQPNAIVGTGLAVLLVFLLAASRLVVRTPGRSAAPVGDPWTAPVVRISDLHATPSPALRSLMVREARDQQTRRTDVSN